MREYSNEERNVHTNFIQSSQHLHDFKKYFNKEVYEQIIISLFIRQLVMVGTHDTITLEELLAMVNDKNGVEYAMCVLNPKMPLRSFLSRVYGYDNNVRTRLGLPTMDWSKIYYNFSEAISYSNVTPVELDLVLEDGGYDE